MMHYSANGWQAVFYAMIAGIKSGALLMAASWLHRHCPKGIRMLTDALCGAGMIALFAHALWQGTEGVFRPFMAAGMGTGMFLFRKGPQAILETVYRRLKR